MAKARTGPLRHLLAGLGSRTFSVQLEDQSLPSLNSEQRAPAYRANRQKSSSVQPREAFTDHAYLYRRNTLVI